MKESPWVFVEFVERGDHVGMATCLRINIPWGFFHSDGQWNSCLLIS